MTIKSFTRRKSFRYGLLIGFFTGLPMASNATTPDAVNQSVIGADAFADMQGVASVNLAAGANNQQANLRAIAVSPGNTAVAAGTVGQHHGVAGGSAQELSGATRIEGTAFRNASGVIGINQVAGSGNQQINAFTLAAGQQGETLSDSALSGSLAMTGVLERSDRPSGAERIVSVDETAFRGARGVVQLNQTVGSGNNSANTLGIRFSSALPN